jgi:catechol 2,3-dioxygenase-like lactoylglutathione lyase family enzyme
VVARLIGINHVALEVGSVDEALAFLERVFGPLTLRGRIRGMAFVDLGDQFLALAETGSRRAGVEERHVGIVVDDKAAVRARLAELGIDELPGRNLDFLDPWGNRLEVVDYREIQFTKAPPVLAGMGLAGLEKSESALAELRDKGLA